MSNATRVIYATVFIGMALAPRPATPCCSFRLPTPNDIGRAVTKVVNDGGKVVGQVATNVASEAGIGLSNVARETSIGAGNVAREGGIVAGNVAREGGIVAGNVARVGGIFVGNVAREGGIGLRNVATTIKKASDDTGAQLNRSQHDLEDAGTAVWRFTMNQLASTRDAVGNAEKRLREGKVIDAMFHLATEPLQSTEKNAANAAMESELLSTVGSVAASVYGGPQGAAAYAAWLTYRQTGDIDMALRVGVIAGASGYANGQASTMARATVTDSIKRAAVVGAIGGAAVAAAGGTPDAINAAFLRGGAAVLVQDGYKAYVQREFGSELGPADGPPMCMAASLEGDPGCPRPTEYLRDEKGRLIMLDRDDKFHYVEPGQEASVPKEWRPIGNASATPPRTPVVGIQTDKLPPPTQFHEGSTVMTNLAKVPGMNAMALFHDRWAVAWEMGPAATKATIVPAIVLTYMGATAVVGNASTTAITDAARASVAASTPPATAPSSLLPPTINEVKPLDASVEALICTKGDSLRIASVVPGKEPGDLRCVIVSDTDGKVAAPYIAHNAAGYCARRLMRMGRLLNGKGWQCKGR